MRTIRTAAFVLLLGVLPACSASGITGSDPAQRLERSTYDSAEPTTAPRLNGGFIGSGS